MSAASVGETSGVTWQDIDSVEFDDPPKGTKLNARIDVLKGTKSVFQIESADGSVAVTLDLRGVTYKAIRRKLRQIAKGGIR